MKYVINFFIFSKNIFDNLKISNFSKNAFLGDFRHFLKKDDTFIKKII